MVDNIACDAITQQNIHSEEDVNNIIAGVNRRIFELALNVFNPNMTAKIHKALSNIVAANCFLPTVNENDENGIFHIEEIATETFCSLMRMAKEGWSQAHYELRDNFINFIIFLRSNNDTVLRERLINLCQEKIQQDNPFGNYDQLCQLQMNTPPGEVLQFIIDNGISTDVLKCFLWKNSDLSGFAFPAALDLSGIDFTESQFCHTTLISTSFFQCIMKCCWFIECQANEINLSGCDLEGALFKDSAFDRPNITYCLLRSAHFIGVSFTEADFSHSRFISAVFNIGSITKSNLSHCDMSKASLQLLNIADCDLSRATLPHWGQMVTASITDCRSPDGNINIEELNFLERGSFHARTFLRISLENQLYSGQGIAATLRSICHSNPEQNRSNGLKILYSILPDIRFLRNADNSNPLIADRLHYLSLAIVACVATLDYQTGSEPQDRYYNFITAWLRDAVTRAESGNSIVLPETSAFTCLAFLNVIKKEISSLDSHILYFAKYSGVVAYLLFHLDRICETDANIDIESKIKEFRQFWCSKVSPDIRMKFAEMLCDIEEADFYLLIGKKRHYVVLDRNYPCFEDLLPAQTAENSALPAADEGIMDVFQRRLLNKKEQENNISKGYVVGLNDEQCRFILEKEDLEQHNLLEFFNERLKADINGMRELLGYSTLPHTSPATFEHFLENDNYLIAFQKQTLPRLVRQMALLEQHSWSLPADKHPAILRSELSDVQTAINKLYRDGEFSAYIASLPNVSNENTRRRVTKNSALAIRFNQLHKALEAAQKKINEIDDLLFINNEEVKTIKSVIGHNKSLVNIHGPMLIFISLFGEYVRKSIVNTDNVMLGHLIASMSKFYREGVLYNLDKWVDDESDTFLNNLFYALHKANEDEEEKLPLAYEKLVMNFSQACMSTYQLPLNDIVKTSARCALLLALVFSEITSAQGLGDETRSPGGLRIHAYLLLVMSEENDPELYKTQTDKENLADWKRILKGQVTGKYSSCTAILSNKMKRAIDVMGNDDKLLQQMTNNFMPAKFRYHWGRDYGRRLHVFTPAHPGPYR